VADDSRFHGLSTPVASSLIAWTAWPDVLADYHQRGEDGVWTRPTEVLPGCHLAVPIIAAWGEMTWEADFAKDPKDPTLVWLRPVTAPARIKSPRQVHSPERLAAAIAADLRAACTTAEGATPSEDELARILRPHLYEILADFSATVALLVQQVRRDRSVATALLRALAELPTPLGQQLLDSPVGSLVYRLARRNRPRPPRRTARK
jgi:hypothetical protein